MQKLALFLLLLSSLATATTVTLTNNIKIDGKVISIDKDYLYIAKEDILVIIEKDVLASADFDAAEPFLKRLAKQRFRRINYNSYRKIIEIDHRNQYNAGIYKDILRYFSDINPANPPYEAPIDPTINKHHYLTIKPLRLFAKWTDISYGYRFTNHNLEWRITGSYLPEYQTKTSGTFSNISNLKSITTSIRYYLDQNCTGIFSGVGYSSATLIVHDLPYYFGFIESEDQAKFEIKGYTFECGITYPIGEHFISSWYAAALAANARYSCLNKNKTGQRLLFIPSANLTFGFLF